MWFASPLLPGIAEERGIDLSLAINLDALGDEGEGTKGQVVALGTIGKTLLSAYVVGQETHACYPFDVLSAVLIAAELVRLIECSPLFTGYAAPRPSTLVMRDLKGAYSVTTPSRAWSCWNIISHDQRSAESLARTSQGATRRLDELVLRLAGYVESLNAADSFRRVAGKSIKIFTYERLLRQSAARSSTFQSSLDAIVREVSSWPGLDLPTRAQKITEYVWQGSRLAGPAVVFGYASMPYSATKTLREINPSLLHCVAREATEVSNRHKVRIHLGERLDVIADTSFLGPIDLDDLKAVKADTPIWNSSIRWDTARSRS
jgi:arginine utilization protein RocB